MSEVAIVTEDDRPKSKRPVTSIPLAERLWAKVDKSGPNGCWIYTGTKINTGYGLISTYTPGESRTTKLAHRVSYELEKGPIPAGLEILHSCDVRACVNPAHLSVGTHKENMEDAAKKGRMPKGKESICHQEPWRMARGENSGRSKLTAEEVRSIRRRYRAGGVTFQELGDEHGMTLAGIRSVVTGRTWSHVADLDTGSGSDNLPYVNLNGELSIESVQPERSKVSRLLLRRLKQAEAKSRIEKLSRLVDQLRPIETSGPQPPSE